MIVGRFEIFDRMLQIQKFNLSGCKNVEGRAVDW